MDPEKENVNGTVEGENNNTEETGNVGTQANTNKDEGKATKTYTQEEYNALDKRLKEKYERKYKGIDIAKYKEWEESQKTAEQKQNDKEKEYQEVLSKNQNLLQENQVLKAGVNVDDVDYVVFKVSKMEGDFEENLADFIKNNPKYIKQEANEKQTKATGTQVRNIDNKISGVGAILRKKHPELFSN